jgi:uncharacterized protein YciI
LRFTLPHFFGDRPGVAPLSVQLLDDVFIALLVAVLAQLKNILELPHFHLEGDDRVFQGIHIGLRQVTEKGGRFRNFLESRRPFPRSSIMFVRFVCCLALLGFASLAAAKEATPAASSTPVEFDSFIVVLLVRPPNAPDIAKAELDQLQEKHISNIRRLADEGKMLKAGPFEDYSGRNVRGMFILKTDSLDQAREWVATDPLVKIGRLVPEYLKWYVVKGSLK